MDDFYFDYPTSRVARYFKAEVVSVLQDEDVSWMHILVRDQNSGVQFWVDVQKDGYWEFNQFIFDRTNVKDRWLEKFFSLEDVILEIDSVVEVLKWEQVQVTL